MDLRNGPLDLADPFRWLLEVAETGLLDVRLIHEAINSDPGVELPPRHLRTNGWYLEIGGCLRAGPCRTAREAIIAGLLNEVINANWQNRSLSRLLKEAAKTNGPTNSVAPAPQPAAPAVGGTGASP